MALAFDTALPPVEKLVLVSLCDFANDVGDSCHPGDTLLAKKASVSTKTIQRVRKRLIDLALIEVEGGGRGRGQAHRYKVKVDNLSTFSGNGKVDSDDPKSGHLRAPVEEPPRTTNGERANALSRKPDVIFEAVAEVLGVPLAKVPKGKNARGAWNAAVRDLKAEEATPAEIIRVAATYRTTWPGIALTPTALAKHFAQLRAVGATDGRATLRAAYAAAYRWIEETGWKLWPDEQAIREAVENGLSHRLIDPANGRVDELVSTAKRIAES